MDTLSDGQKQTFKSMDNAYLIIFLVDMIIYILTDEHHDTEGRWSFKRSCLKQFESRLFFDLIAIIPFPKLLEGTIRDEIKNLLYMLKVVRLYHGFKLLNYK